MTLFSLLLNCINIIFPFIYVGVYNCSVKENTEGLLENCTAVAHDKDSGLFGQLNYSVVDAEVRYFKADMPLKSSCTPFL